MLSPLYIRVKWSWRFLCHFSHVVFGFYFLRRNPYILSSTLADMFGYFLPELLVGNSIQIKANIQNKLLNYRLEQSSSSISIIWSTSVLRLNDMVSSVIWGLAYVLTSLGRHFDPHRSVLSIDFQGSKNYFLFKHTGKFYVFNIGAAQS